MTDRLQILSQSLPEEMDAAFVTSSVSRRYLLGFPSSAGTVIVTKDKSWFIIDSRYFEAAQANIKHCEVVPQNKLYEQITEILRKHAVKTVGIETDKVSVTKYNEMKEKLPDFEILQSVFLSRQIEKQRRVKSADEIAEIQAAQDIADKTFTHILGFIKAGRTELEITVEMEQFARRIGSEGPSFDYIVAAGANSSRPHAVPTDYKVKTGDFIVLDFGCKKNGYCSDMTRTIAVGGASDRQREVYEIVSKAGRAALDVIKAGVRCLDVDKTARDLIDATGYKGLFGHGLGHSLGLEVHEEPRFSTECGTALETGMCMSVEPGIYIPGEFGVRIEDIVAANENGYHNFCKSDKSLIIV